MKADTMKGRDGGRLAIYRCRGAKAAGKCPAPSSVLARLIEPWVVERFMERAGEADASAARLNSDIAGAEKKVKSARAQLDSYIEADIEGAVGVERYRGELRRRRDILDTAEEELARVHERAGGDLPDPTVLRATWPDLDLAERRQLLSLGIDAIFLRRAPRQGLSALDSRTLVHWRSEGPDDLPGPGRRIGAIRSVAW
jgi:hypothetical protein